MSAAANSRPAAVTSIMVHVPMTIRQRGGRNLVVAPDGAPAWAPTRARIDTTMVKALARAFRWRRMLETGAVSTVREIAAKEKINGSYVSRVLHPAGASHRGGVPGWAAAGRNDAAEADEAISVGGSS